MNDSGIAAAMDAARGTVEQVDFGMKRIERDARALLEGMSLDRDGNLRLIVRDMQARELRAQNAEIFAKQCADDAAAMKKLRGYLAERISDTSVALAMLRDEIKNRETTQQDVEHELCLQTVLAELHALCIEVGMGVPKVSNDWKAGGVEVPTIGTADGRG